MNGFGAEEPMVSGAAWQRARSSPTGTRPAASHAQYHHLTRELPPQIYALVIALLRYLTF